MTRAMQTNGNEVHVVVEKMGTASRKSRINEDGVMKPGTPATATD